MWIRFSRDHANLMADIVMLQLTVKCSSFYKIMTTYITSDKLISSNMSKNYFS